MERVILTAQSALMSRLFVGGFKPLLPAQRAVQARLREAGAFRVERELETIATRRANGAAIETLHHRRWPQSNHCFKPAGEWS
ncbi:MAG: hypothetical protein HYX63_13525 [Gammaproteobacteria bacterium]|nr:hypothetical protein [Gammaproteobacteria bacterium]